MGQTARTRTHFNSA